MPTQPSRSPAAGQKNERRRAPSVVERAAVVLEKIAKELERLRKDLAEREAIIAALTSIERGR